MQATYYNDIKPFCCKVLRKQIASGNLPEGYVDERSITDVLASELMGYQHVHLFAGIGAFPLGFLRAGVPFTRRILTGGFPCQDISIAGEQAGITGERSGLWKEMLRIIRESSNLGNPFDYVVIENVRNLLSGGDYEEAQTKAEEESDRSSLRATGTRNMDDLANEPVFRTWMGEVLRDVAESGYDAEWTVLRAADYGAPHIRERVFIMAYPINTRCQNTRHISPFTLSRRQESRWIESTGRARRSGESAPCDELAHLPGIRGKAWRSESTEWRQANPDGAGSSTQSIISDTYSQRCQECNAPAWDGNEGLSTRRVSTRRVQGMAQSQLGGIFNGLPDWLDGYRWPARPGEQQYIWEPERVSPSRQPDSIARLEALGNAVVVAVAEAIGYALRNHINLACQ